MINSNNKKTSSSKTQKLKITCELKSIRNTFILLLNVTTTKNMCNVLYYY